MLISYGSYYTCYKQFPTIMVMRPKVFVEGFASLPMASSQGWTSMVMGSVHGVFPQLRNCVSCMHSVACGSSLVSWLQRVGELTTEGVLLTLWVLPFLRRGECEVLTLPSHECT